MSLVCGAQEGICRVNTFSQSRSFLLSLWSHRLISPPSYKYIQADEKDLWSTLIDIGSGAVIYIPSFMKIGWDIQKLIERDSQTHRQHRDCISLRSAFHNKESRLRKSETQKESRACIRARCLNSKMIHAPEFELRHSCTVVLSICTSDFKRFKRIHCTYMHFKLKSQRLAYQSHTPLPHLQREMSSNYVDKMKHW
jgi:hypothetical protein